MISGKFAQADNNGSPIVGVFEWRCEPRGDELDGTTGASGGFEAPEIGVRGYRTTLRGIYDDVFGMGSYLDVGSILTNVNLYIDEGAATAVFAFGEAIVLAAPIVVPVRGRMEWELQIASRGSDILVNA